MEPWLEPLYDAAGMRAADSWAIEQQGVPSLELMEAAGAAVAEAAREVAGAGPARVVCGKGNNGGDGLVAARRLGETGYEVEVLLLWPAAELSPDARANLDRFAGPAREIGPGGGAKRARGRGHRRRGAWPPASTPTGLDQVQLRGGPGGGRLARPDGRGVHGRPGGDPRWGGLRDGGGAGRPRADLRGEADRGHVARVRRRHRPARKLLRRGHPRGGAAGRGRRPRARPGAARGLIRARPRGGP